MDELAAAGLGLGARLATVGVLLDFSPCGERGISQIFGVRQRYLTDWSVMSEVLRRIGGYLRGHLAGSGALGSPLDQSSATTILK
jgi:hypothetical protein